jgi:hypothetical protein
MFEACWETPDRNWRLFFVNIEDFLKRSRISMRKSVWKVNNLMLVEFSLYPLLGILDISKPHSQTTD